MKKTIRVFLFFTVLTTFDLSMTAGDEKELIINGRRPKVVKHPYPSYPKIFEPYHVKARVKLKVLVKKMERQTLLK